MATTLILSSFYDCPLLQGDSCLFRHEEGALGCEITCSYWKEGKCFNQHCNFRHMELKKNRKSIPCYWETQPSGCCKPHCPFMHRNQKSGSETPKEGDNCSFFLIQLHRSLKQMGKKIFLVFDIAHHCISLFFVEFNLILSSIK